MNALDRARRANAAAEAAAEAGDAKTAAAYRASAAAWEQIARPGQSWSHEPAQRSLTALKRELAVATGPFQPPRDPKAPSPAAAGEFRPTRLQKAVAEELARRPAVRALIEF